MSPENGGEQAPSPEMERTEQPRIYAASLSDYNTGRLHGTYIPADQSAEEIHQAIQAMLAKSQERGAEEWAIHDYEGFYGLHLSEYESIEHVAKIGQGIAEHGPAFAAWAGVLGSSQWDEDLDKFEDCYRGEWESLKAFGEDFVEDMGMTAGLDSLDEWLRSYISVDVEAVARDMTTDMNMAPSPNGGIYLFE